MPPIATFGPKQASGATRKETYSQKPRPAESFVSERAIVQIADDVKYNFLKYIMEGNAGI